MQGESVDVVIECGHVSLVACCNLTLNIFCYLPEFLCYIEAICVVIILLACILAAEAYFCISVSFS